MSNSAKRRDRKRRVKEQANAKPPTPQTTDALAAMLAREIEIGLREIDLAGLPNNSSFVCGVSELDILNAGARVATVMRRAQAEEVAALQVEVNRLKRTYEPKPEVVSADG